MKRLVKWHKECLENLRLSAMRYRSEAARAIADAERCERECIVRDAQIIRAELQGITEYDADKFNKPRPARAAAEDADIKEKP